jgi:hypothetical protein
MRGYETFLKTIAAGITAAFAGIASAQGTTAPSPDFLRSPQGAIAAAKASKQNIKPPKRDKNCNKKLAGDAAHRIIHPILMERLHEDNAPVPQEAQENAQEIFAGWKSFMEDIIGCDNGVPEIQKLAAELKQSPVYGEKFEKLLNLIIINKYEQVGAYYDQGYFADRAQESLQRVITPYKDELDALDQDRLKPYINKLSERVHKFVETNMQKLVTSNLKEDLARGLNVTIPVANKTPKPPLSEFVERNIKDVLLDAYKNGDLVKPEEEDESKLYLKIA